MVIKLKILRSFPIECNFNLSNRRGGERGIRSSLSSIEERRETERGLGGKKGAREIVDREGRGGMTEREERGETGGGGGEAHIRGWDGGLRVGEGYRIIIPGVGVE